MKMFNKNLELTLFISDRLESVTLILPKPLLIGFKRPYIVGRGKVRYPAAQKSSFSELELVLKGLFFQQKFLQSLCRGDHPFSFDNISLDTLGGSMF